MAKAPNLANDQQGRIKIPVLPDLFKTKCVRHLNMLCLANTEKKRLQFLQIGVNILSEIQSILSFYNMQSSQQYSIFLKYVCRQNFQMLSSHCINFPIALWTKARYFEVYIFHLQTQKALFSRLLFAVRVYYCLILSFCWLQSCPYDKY